MKLASSNCAISLSLSKEYIKEHLICALGICVDKEMKCHSSIIVRWECISEPMIPYVSSIISKEEIK